jgi:hypothetical protein
MKIKIKLQFSVISFGIRNEKVFPNKDTTENVAFFPSLIKKVTNLLTLFNMMLSEHFYFPFCLHMNILFSWWWS